MDDSVASFEGVGDKKMKALVNSGVHTVADLKEKDDEELVALSAALDGISHSKLLQWRDSFAHPGTCPYTVIDYRKENNPYKARYGDTWEEEIRQTKFMRQYCCITELVQHIHDSSKAAFVGTVHENDWYFYHDALKQLTAKSTVEWMKKKDIYKRWLIPQLGLNFGTLYFARPIGNRPEWMPLDMSLNNDIQSALSLHCAITSYLADDDNRKFSLATPDTIVSGIRRIFGNTQGDVPCSKRIVEDCNKALHAFGVVYNHGGDMVPGLANRNGHRNIAAGRNTSGWGGLRVKNLLVAEKDKWLHTDAVSVKNSRTVEILTRISCEDYSSGEEGNDDVSDDE